VLVPGPMRAIFFTRPSVIERDERHGGPSQGLTFVAPKQRFSPKNGQICHQL
ncbi:hypothetical protein SK128_022094, partial [Halocaridina rubra]